MWITGYSYAASVILPIPPETNISMYSTYISEGRTIPDKNTVSCYRPVYLSAWLAIVEREESGALDSSHLSLPTRLTHRRPKDQCLGRQEDALGTGAGQICYRQHGSSGLQACKPGADSRQSRQKWNHAARVQQEVRDRITPKAMRW